jgi:pyruvate formate lyase activating enzyme
MSFEPAPGVPARRWTPRESGLASCSLCFRGCRLSPGQRGFCEVRLNHGGELRSLNWGHTGALALDPVEKKPLYHFRPGTLTFSVGAPGCNLACRGCQNHHLSRPGPGYREPPAPDGLTGELIRTALARGADSVSLTYSEPTVFYEYAADLGRAANEAGLATIWVTNGSMAPEILEDLALAAMNIDLKGFTEEFYRSVTKGSLAPVLANIERALELGIWVETTTLLIPGLNDSEGELRSLSAWLASLSKDLPWHVSRFFPRHKQLDVPATPPESLMRARDIGRAEGLRHVYVGNLQGDSLGDTVCPGCGEVLVKRAGYAIELDRLSGGAGACPACGEVVAGRWV